MKDNNIQNRCVFTIDLLKGQGIPLRNGPAGFIIASITAIVPVVIAFSLYGLYQNNMIVTKFKKQDLLRLEDKTAALSDAVKMQKNLEKEKGFYKSCLSEVKGSIGKFSQWSPVLTTLTEEMPPSVILTNLSVKLVSIEKEVPKPDDPKKTIKVNVPVTRLLLKVNNQGQEDCSEEVKEFRDRLYTSSVLGQKLQGIPVFSRKSARDGGKEIVSYEIECMLKPE